MLYFSYSRSLRLGDFCTAFYDLIYYYLKDLKLTI